jgi:membrane associated rhomboid family serine protease
MDELFRQIGRYEVVGRIGSGGFAAVYRGRDTNLDREVAVKVMRPLLLSDVAFVKRFRQEARTVANLDHPNIVPIYDYGEIEDRLCLVMKLLAGGSLAELVATGPLPWPRVVQVSAQIAAALDYAHERGLVHRDIKPENVLLDSEGNAVLGDFGLVRALESGRLTTSLSGGVLGTPAYLAPEVWNGLPGTRATDVYGMACVVFEMVTGEQLFDAPTPPATMMLHFRPPQFPERWPEGVPPGLDRVLRRALARNAEDRYPSAGAFAAELAALEDDPLAERYAALEAAAAAEQWDDAVALAERIVDEAPGYREARQLLEQASEGRMAVQQQAWAAQWAAAAKHALAEGDQEGALTAARHWQQLAPEDGEAAAMVERLQAPSQGPEVAPQPEVEKMTFAAPESVPVEAVESGGGAVATRLGDWRWRVAEEEVVEPVPPGRRRQPRRAQVQGRAGWLRAWRLPRILQRIFYAPSYEDELGATEPDAAQAVVGLRAPLTRPVISYVLVALFLVLYATIPIESLWNYQVDLGSLFGPMFVHGSLWLVVLYSFGLYIIGPEVEARYGYGRFAFLYFGAGLVANLSQLIVYGPYRWYPWEVAPFVGAHGPVLGVAGALLALLVAGRLMPGRAATIENATSRRFLLLIAGFIIAMSLAIGIDLPVAIWPVRAISLTTGLVLGYLLAPRYEVDSDAPGGYRDTATLRRRWWVVAGTLVLIVAGLMVVLDW